MTGEYVYSFPQISAAIDAVKKQKAAYDAAHNDFLTAAWALANMWGGSSSEAQNVSVKELEKVGLGITETTGKFIQVLIANLELAQQTELDNTHLFDPA